MHKFSLTHLYSTEQSIQLLEQGLNRISILSVLKSEQRHDDILNSDFTQNKLPGIILNLNLNPFIVLIKYKSYLGPVLKVLYFVLSYTVIHSESFKILSNSTNDRDRTVVVKFYRKHF